jgi:hypothetical protein
LKHPDLEVRIVWSFSLRLYSLKNLGADEESEVGEDCGELEVELEVELMAELDGEKLWKDEKFWFR